MFERYTEKARRTIFFARYEASQFGSPEIESEHLLLGILREGKALASLLLSSDASVESIRKQIEAKATFREKSSTSVDLPLSNECKRILAYAAEEAHRLAHKHIGAEHLILGILREDSCFAARLLRERGLNLDETRVKISASSETSGETASSVADSVANAMSTLQALRSRAAAATRVVDSYTSETVFEYRCQTSPPHIGETILVRDADGASQSYKVEDVRWEFEKSADGTIVQTVQVRVANLEIV